MHKISFLLISVFGSRFLRSKTIPCNITVCTTSTSEHKKDGSFLCSTILPTSTSLHNTVRVGVHTTRTSAGTANPKKDFHSSDSMYQCDITHGYKVPNAISVSRFLT